MSENRTLKEELEYVIQHMDEWVIHNYQGLEGFTLVKRLDIFWDKKQNRHIIYEGRDMIGKNGTQELTRRMEDIEKEIKIKIRR
jgi:hypothetical protein